MKTLYILGSFLFFAQLLSSACKHRQLNDKRSQSAAQVDAPDDEKEEIDRRVRSPLYLNDMPYSKDINDLNKTGPERSKFVIDYFANQPIGLFPLNKADALDFAARAVASIRKSVHTKKLDELLKNGRAYGLLGSSSTDSSCVRTGDFDIAALGLTWILYEAALKPSTLSNKALTHIMTDLLPSGKNHYEFIKVDGCATYRDTQTHIFITETSRYLNNQMIKSSLPAFKNQADYDNESSGFNEWMRAKLKSFYIDYFDDYNARPTESLNITALHLLYNFSDDESVRTLAEGLLHIKSALYATQSSYGRRMPVFHREEKYNALETIYQQDAQLSHMSILAGNYKHFTQGSKPFEIKYAKHLALLAATSRYRLPSTIATLILEPSFNDYLQIFRHKNYERYYNSKSFRISGGGWYQKTRELGKDVITEAQPLVIFPHKSKEIDYRKFIHFLGKKDPTQRENHCITKNFACGIDLVIPDTIAESCKSKVEGLDGWEFFNFSTTQCPMKWGFYAAVYTGAYSTNNSKLGNFAVVELLEASTDEGFNNFKAIIKDNHKNNIPAATAYPYKPVFEDENTLLKEIKVVVDSNPYNTGQVNSCHFERAYTTPKDLRTEKRATGIREIISSENGNKYTIRSSAFKLKLIIDVEKENAPSIKEERE